MWRKVIVAGVGDKDGALFVCAFFLFLHMLLLFSLMGYYWGEEGAGWC
jgi:hypothetical protein